MSSPFNRGDQSNPSNAKSSSSQKNLYRKEMLVPEHQVSSFINNQNLKTILFYRYQTYSNVLIDIDCELGERMEKGLEKLGIRDSVFFFKSNENFYSGVIYKVIQSKSDDFKIIVKVQKKENDMIYTIRPKDIIEIKQELKKTLESQNKQLIPKENSAKASNNSEIRDVHMESSSSEMKSTESPYFNTQESKKTRSYGSDPRQEERKEVFNKKNQNSSSLMNEELSNIDQNPIEVVPFANKPASDPIQPSELQIPAPTKPLKPNLTLSDLNLLIGEIVYFVPSQGIIHLASSLEQIRLKQIPDSYTKGSILKILDINPYLTVLSNEVSISTALFYQYNKIDPSYPCSSLNNRKGYFLTSPKISNFKLLPKPKIQKLVENDPVELSENYPLPSLILGQNYTFRPDVKSFRLSSVYTNLEIQNLLVSFPFNTTFQFIFSLALFENYFRFPEISALNTNNMPDSLKSSSIAEIKGCFTANIKNFKYFYEFVLKYADTFKRAGDDMCNLVNADYYTYSGLQKFCDQFQVVIEYSSFNDSPYKVVLNPTLITKPVIEIIHIGEFRRGFFNIYPEEAHSYEFDPNFGYKDLQTWPTSRPFSIIYNNQNETKLLNIINQISKKVQSFNDICIKKAQGLTYNSNMQLDLQEEVSTIKSLIFSKNDSTLNELLSSLGSIDFTNTIYNISPPKFTCLCCREKGIDSNEFKIRLSCGCEYKKDHYETNVKINHQTCFCGTTKMFGGNTGMSTIGGGYGGAYVNSMNPGGYANQAYPGNNMGYSQSVAFNQPHPSINARQMNPSMGINPSNNMYQNQRYNYPG